MELLTSLRVLSRLSWSRPRAFCMVFQRIELEIYQSQSARCAQASLAEGGLVSRFRSHKGENEGNR